MIRMRITRRKPLPKWARVAIPIAAILLTLILSAIPILLAGGHLWKSYFYLFYGALGTRFNLLETFVKAREEGKVRHLGFSAHSEEAAVALAGQFDFDDMKGEESP